MFRRTFFAEIALCFLCSVVNAQDMDLKTPDGFHSGVFVAGEKTFYGQEKIRPSVLVISKIDRPLAPEMLTNRSLQKAYLDGLKQILQSKNIENFVFQGVARTAVGAKRALLYSYSFSEGKSGHVVQGKTLLMEWNKREALSIDFTALTAHARSAWDESLKSLVALEKSQGQMK